MNPCHQVKNREAQRQWFCSQLDHHPPKHHGSGFLESPSLVLRYLICYHPEIPS